MTAEQNSIMTSPDPQPCAAESPPIKSESLRCPQAAVSAIAASVASLSKEAKQRFLITEIKKLVEDCDDFIGLAPGEHGVPEIIVSSNLKPYKYAIISDAHIHYKEHLRLRDPTETGKGRVLICPGTKGQEHTSLAHVQLPSGSISYPFQRGLKRHRSRTVRSQNPATARYHQLDRRTRLGDVPASQIRVDDNERLAEWFKEAFFALQQVACRLVAKVWIKKIHPKKQSTHPYNGQMPRHKPADPSRTRPPYWPSDVIHREPDHIGREDRTRLLVHLIMHTPQTIITNPPADPHNQQYVTARNLLECLEPKRGELKDDRWEIIHNIISAREKQEQYKAGEIDGDTLVFLYDYSDHSRVTSGDSDDETVAADVSAQAVSTDGSDEVGEAMEAASSSSRASPTEAGRREAPVPVSRLRGGESSTNRRSSGRRARPSMNGLGPASMIVPRAAQDFPTDLSMSMDGAPPTGGLVTMQHQLPTEDFDRSFNPHAGAGDMMQAIAHHGHPTLGLDIPSWPSMMPDIGHHPADNMFVISPNITPHANDFRHPYFGHHHHDMNTGLHASMPVSLMHPTNYRELQHEDRRTLPLRMADASNPGVIPPPDVTMDMMSNHFYGH